MVILGPQSISDWVPMGWNVWFDLEQNQLLEDKVMNLSQKFP